MLELVGSINSVLWSPLIYVCLAVGLFYSVVTRFPQVRHFREMCRLMLSGGSSEQGVSSFQALALSVSGRVGTGNIAGVAAAIGFGGPGAVFWMWVVAFLGAATAYIESALGQIYKEEYEGQYRGGPAFYIEKAIGVKWFAWIFAIATIIACGVLLPTVQSNAIGNAVSEAFGAGQTLNTFMGEISSSKVISGVLIAIPLGIIIFGGVKRIASVAQFIVPFMAIAYILTALIIIGLNIEKLPSIVGLIIGDAFSPMAAFGGMLYWGIKRGVYSNEAGQGTGPHAAAAAEVQHPAQQGLVQSFSVYVDTLFVCSATAFMILITGTYNVHGGEEGVFLVQNIATSIDAGSPVFTQMAIENTFPGFGSIFVALALCFFSFTTLLAYYFIAETNVSYLRHSFKFPGMYLSLRLLIMAATFYGAVKTANLAWGLGDIGVAMMAWLNLIGILIIFFIGKPAVKALFDYEKQKKAGATNFSFDPEKLGIKNAKFWEDRLKKQKAKKAD